MRPIIPLALTLALAAGEADTLAFRNGTAGVWPSARPPTVWNEWVWKEETGTDERGKRRQVRTITGDDRKGIVWKTELPFWGNGQPLVISGRIYLLHEMEYWDEAQMGPRLVCLDAKDGKELWSKEVNHLDLVPGDRAKVTQAWLEERRWVAARVPSRPVSAVATNPSALVPRMGVNSAADHAPSALASALARARGVRARRSRRARARAAASVLARGTVLAAGAVLAGVVETAGAGAAATSAAPRLTEPRARTARARWNMGCPSVPALPPASR